MGDSQLNNKYILFRVWTCVKDIHLAVLGDKNELLVSSYDALGFPYTCYYYLLTGTMVQ